MTTKARLVKYRRALVVFIIFPTKIVCFGKAAVPVLSNCYQIVTNFEVYCFILGPDLNFYENRTERNSIDLYCLFSKSPKAGPARYEL